MRTGKSKKRQKGVTEKAAVSLDKRVKLYVRRHGNMNYEEALSAVVRRDPKLYKRSVKERPKRDELQEVKELADYLNSDAANQHEVENLWAPIIDPPSSTPEKVTAAAQLLCEKLSTLKTGWQFLALIKGKPKFAIFFPGGPVGWLAYAIQFGHLSKLKRCAWRECKRFFVTTDHREKFCDNACLRKSESARVKEWRTRTESY